MTTTTAFESTAPPPLRFARLDPERRLGLNSGYGTSPSVLSTLLLTLTLAFLIYTPAWLFRDTDAGSSVWHALTAYQRIPVAITLTSCCAAAILILKWLKIRCQRRSLQVSLLPEDPDFRIDGRNVDRVLARIAEQIDEPEQFILSNRMDRVLRNVRNVGRVADIDEIFTSAADADESRMESSYTVIRGLVWAIPVLGFIGTIVGLTMAIGEFQGVLDASGGEKMALVTELGKVIAGLQTAFVTTGEGLVAALVLQLGMVVIRRGDETLLDDIRDHCTIQVLSLVRLEARE